MLAYVVLLAVILSQCTQQNDYEQPQTSALFGGVEEGNGGDVLHCKDRNSNGELGKTLELPPVTFLLDYVEAKIRWPELKIDLGEDQLPVYEKVSKAVERLKKLDHERYTIYKQFVRTFDSEIRWLTDAGSKIKDVQDNGYIPIEFEKCDLRQMAIQTQPRFPEDKRYLIDKSLWDIMASNDNRAGLILHEIIYRDALLRGHEDSSAVRYLTTLLSSKNAETLDQEQYQKIIGISGLTHLRHQSIVFIHTKVNIAGNWSCYDLGFDELDTEEFLAYLIRKYISKLPDTDVYQFVKTNNYFMQYRESDSFVRKKLDLSRLSIVEPSADEPQGFFACYDDE